MLAAMIVCGPLSAAPARADGPFETVPLPVPTPRPHRAAYVCLAGGTGLMVASIVFARRADHAYDRYLAASAPDEIQRRFSETARYDRWSSGSLLTGEALLAAGLYLRFLRRPSAPVSVALGPGRCAVCCRF